MKSAGSTRNCGARREDLRTQEEDLAKADAAYASQMDIKLAEISQAESEVKFREKHASSSRELVDADGETLEEPAVSPEVELIRLRLDLARIGKGPKRRANARSQQVKLEQKRMETENSRRRSEKTDGDREN